MTEHQMALYLGEVLLLVVAARVGGELAARLRIPAVVGELSMGIALGPSLLGHVWPGGFRALFPPDHFQRGLLELTGWIGVILLVMVAGFETRLGLLRNTGRAVLSGWVGAFFLPLGAGFALGMAVPALLIPHGIDRPMFALFLGTALSISAIPVIARILMDLGQLSTRIGSLILATALADDTVGWMVLAFVAGMVRGRADAGSVARTAVLTCSFVVVAFTAGKRLVVAAVTASHRMRAPHAETSVMMALVVGAALLTQLIGVHLVLGAFMMSILLGRAPRRAASDHAVRTVGLGFFVPFFFAYTGIKVDLTALRGNILAVTVVAVGVACVSKLAGGWLGGLAGGLQTWEAAAVGVGLNARGAMELVIAAIGLSIGVLTPAAYSIVVVIAVVTTLMAGPMLRFCLSRVEAEALPGRVEATVVRARIDRPQIRRAE